ncbi:MFS transporter [Niabella yanshanensis]|uniref:MFS transporter n=1 Tax=Niabella yanshanensis TaxID=577386 RepID=A0ABZ0WB17_9BACT|nr:MFS transporter [Niabella yanshanensis]WQD39674.1 MFS transporter [Niabella yanshanensis]
MRSSEFIGLSACCMMLTAIGIDVMLPAFSDIRRDFRIDAGSSGTSFIVTVFFLGQLFQILFGPMSDRLGRLYVLRLGFVLYILGSLGAALSADLVYMLIARFIAGAGASAVFMTVIAMVRDRFNGDKMAQVMSFIFTIFLFTPVAAPFLGLAILKLCNWRIVFMLPPLFAIVILFWSLRMKETLPVGKRSGVKASRQFVLFKIVMRDRSFLRYTLITTFLFGGIASYVSNAEFIIVHIYRSPRLFPWVFACIGVIMAAGALLNSKLVSIYGAEKTLTRLLSLYLAIALIMLAGACFYMPVPDLYFFFTCIALLLGINLAVEPNSSSLAMHNVGDYAGTASALYGTCFFLGGALLGSLISYFLSFGLIAMAIGFAVIGLISFLLNKRQ